MLEHTGIKEDKVLKLYVPMTFFSTRRSLLILFHLHFADIVMQFKLLITLTVDKNFYF